MLLADVGIQSGLKLTAENMVQQLEREIVWSVSGWTRQADTKNRLGSARFVDQIDSRRPAFKRLRISKGRFAASLDPWPKCVLNRFFGSRGIDVPDDGDYRATRLEVRLVKGNDIVVRNCLNRGFGRPGAIRMSGAIQDLCEHRGADRF